MLTLKDYVQKVMNEDENENENQIGAAEAEAEADEGAEKPEKAEKQECDTVLHIECCGTALKKIIDAIKKTKGDFKVEIDTGDEEKELKIEWDGDDNMIGAVKSEKKEATEELENEAFVKPSKPEDITAKQKEQHDIAAFRKKMQNQNKPQQQQ